MKNKASAARQQGLQVWRRKTLRAPLLASLASVAFHILLVGIVFANSARISPPAGLPRNEHVIQLQLHRPNTDTLPGAPDPSVQTSDIPASSVPLATAEAHSGQDDVSTTVGILLPPAEPIYVPSSELSTRPQPYEPILIPFPDATLDRPKVTAILVLFIGADGHVDRIEVDASDLPPPFQKAAIDAFLQAKMNPGIKDGMATRARMRVFVEFEAR